MSKQRLEQTSKIGQMGHQQIQGLIANRNAQAFQDRSEVEKNQEEAEMRHKSSWLPLLSAGTSIGTMISPGIGTAIGAGIGGLGGLISSLVQGGHPFDPKYLFSPESAMSLIPMAQAMAASGLFSSSPLSSSTGHPGIDAPASNPYKYSPTSSSGNTPLSPAALARKIV